MCEISCFFVEEISEFFRTIHFCSFCSSSSGALSLSITSLSPPPSPLGPFLSLAMSSSSYSHVGGSDASAASADWAQTPAQEHTLLEPDAGSLRRTLDRAPSARCIIGRSHAAASLSAELGLGASAASIGAEPQTAAASKHKSAPHACTEA